MHDVRYLVCIHISFYMGKQPYLLYNGKNDKSQLASSISMLLLCTLSHVVKLATAIGNVEA